MFNLPNGHYALEPHQVPNFPVSDRWVDHLRWCLAVMDANDDDIAFAASLLSHAINNGGLTEKQVKYATRTVKRVQALWLAEQLRCQRHNAPASRRPSLRLVDTQGGC